MDLRGVTGIFLWMKWEGGADARQRHERWRCVFGRMGQLVGWRWKSVDWGSDVGLLSIACIESDVCISRLEGPCEYNPI